MTNSGGKNGKSVMQTATRRRILQGGVAAMAAWLCQAHAPYKQWVVYRQTHLMILATKTDAPSFPLSKKVANLLAIALPESRARVALAPDLSRAASLLSTRQIELAVVSTADAARLLAGGKTDQSLPSVPISLLFALGHHHLVCHEAFRPIHAYTVVETLDGHRARLAEARQPADPAGVALDIHAGAAAYWQGLPPPDPAVDG